MEKSSFAGKGVPGRELVSEGPKLAPSPAEGQNTLGLDALELESDALESIGGSLRLPTNTRLAPVDRYVGEDPQNLENLENPGALVPILQLDSPRDGAGQGHPLTPEEKRSYAQNEPRTLGFPRSSPEQKECTHGSPGILPGLPCEQDPLVGLSLLVDPFSASAFS